MSRFRVALSFPGEHRPRIEKIAEALANRLGREKVLYDRWYAPEFNRPNLDTYLSSLYHDDSDLVAVFVCKEYNAKEWCGLEWRACRELLKQKQDARLMFFRLDNADIPGLYSIDGYQDIQNMSAEEVAAAILSRAPGPRPPAHSRSGEPGTCRIFTSKLPIVNPTLIGRDLQLAFLDRAWADPATNFVQIIAAGGAGKTALVDKWFRPHLNEADIFGWSFYSQGASPDRQTSSDPFFAEILPWLHTEIAPTASIYAKADAVAGRLREQRVLLLLDGVEPLQDAAGALRDAALKALAPGARHGQPRPRPLHHTRPPRHPRRPAARPLHRSRQPHARAGRGVSAQSESPGRRRRATASLSRVLESRAGADPAWDLPGRLLRRRHPPPHRDPRVDGRTCPPRHIRICAHVCR